MNRPKRKKYKGRSGKIYFTELYIGQLEEYCDELEEKVAEQTSYIELLKSSYVSAIDENESLAEEVDKLDKELDKIIFQLEVLMERKVNER